MLKRPKGPDSFRGRVKGKVRERVTGCTISSWTSFWLVGDEDRVMFQESQSSTFWFQPVWGLRAGGQHAVNLFYLVRVLVSAKQLKDMAQDILYST